MVNVSTFSLKLRLFLATIFLFGILYVIIMLISSYFGFGGPLLFAVFGIICGVYPVLDWTEDGRGHDARTLRIRTRSTKFTCYG